MTEINEEYDYNKRMLALTNHLIAESAKSVYLRKRASTDEDKRFHSGRLSVINDLVDYIMEAEGIE